MIDQIFATKISMGQTWTKSGRRLPVSKLMIQDNLVLGKRAVDTDGHDALQIGYGKKKLKNMTKPLKSLLEKSGFSLGVRQIKEVRTASDDALQVGAKITAADVLKVGDVVNVQGISKGRGFAGAMKRHGFSGQQKTHGQSDRARAVGAIGQRTTPGRVFKGKKMAGHYGLDTITVKNLLVVHLDPQTGEVWLNGPIPGHFTSTVRLTVVDHTDFEGLDQSVAPEMTAVREEVAVDSSDQVEATPSQTEEAVQE